MSDEQLVIMLDEGDLDLIKEAYLKILPDLIITCLNKGINSFEAADWALCSLKNSLILLKELNLNNSESQDNEASDEK